MLYKMDLLCLERDIFSVVNIRLKITEFEFKKKQRKLMRNNDARFRTTIRKADPGPEQEKLYQKQKARFKGFIHETLHDHLFQGHPYTPFDTYEINVYDGDRLIASSLFDLGQKSVASLIGIQDPDYAKYSLGTYTMLKEIEYARTLQMRWYYPGYVLDKPSSFSYKLRLGDFQYYNHNKRWVSIDKFVRNQSLAEQFKKKLARMEDCLRHYFVEYDAWLYPYFSMGYMSYWSVQFVRSARFLEIPTGNNNRLIITYNLEDQEYQLLWASSSASQDQLITMELSEEFKNDPKYLLDLLEIESIIHTSTEPATIAKKVIEITSKTGTSNPRNHLR